MSVKENNQTGKLSRRKFLGTLGKGAVALAMPNIFGVRAAIGAQEVERRRFVIREDRFGRIFPDLRAFAEPSPKLSEALMELGKPGGVLDARDNLGAGPLALIVDPTLNVDNPNNDTHTAGTTFMGQFIDHDMTFDLTSRLAVALVTRIKPCNRLSSAAGALIRPAICVAWLHHRIDEVAPPFGDDLGASFERLCQSLARRDRRFAFEALSACHRHQIDPGIVDALPDPTILRRPAAHLRYSFLVHFIIIV